jgi:hypothetical protein
MKVKKGGGEWTVAAREGHPEAKQLDNGRYKLLFEGGYGSAYLDWEPIIEEVSYPPAGFKIGDRVTTSSFRSAERTVVTIEEWLRIGGSQSVVDDREERNSVLCRDDNGYAVHNPASGYKLVETAEAGNVAAYPPAGWNVGDVFTKGFRKDRYVVVSLDEANAGFQRPAPGKAEGWAKDGRLLYRYEDTEHNGKWCYQGSPSEGTKVESAGDRAIAAVFLDRDPVDDPNAVVARFEGDSGWRA